MLKQANWRSDYGKCRCIVYIGKYNSNHFGSSTGALFALPASVLGT